MAAELSTYDSTKTPIMDHLSFDEIFTRLRTGDESVAIEAKRSEEFGNSTMETVSAFANEPGRGGGYLVFGVVVEPATGNYEIIGVPNLDKLQTELATKCATMLNVPLRPLITVEQRANRNVIVAFVPEAQPHDKPVFIRSRGLPAGAFRRIGSTDQQCTDDDLALLFQGRRHETFDEGAVPGTDLDDIDSEAVAEYRRTRAETNPSAVELSYGDVDLLHALAATTRQHGRTCLTIAGLMLFARPATLRRHFPSSRVDYIRVEGREWVSNPDYRYQTVELAGPLLTLIPRVVAHVLSDIPRAFALGDDNLHRRDVPLIPRTVIREAVVNALMHRSYRLRQPVQIIRYSNRIEIRNPGHSLVPDDRLGEPGSISRNEKIAAVLHEAGLAETKGTGIKAMRQAMDRANLTLPLFESDWQKDAFTVTLLVHHLLGPEDTVWLARFRDLRLSDDEARALVVLREVGAINNAAYRDINHMDTLSASGHLRRLRDLGLLEQRGKGSATYYIPTDRLMRAESASTTTGVGARAGRNPVDNGLSTELGALPAGFPPLPADLAEQVEKLGQRSTPDEVRRIIFNLCLWRPLRPSELAVMLRRNQFYLVSQYLRPMVRAGELSYVYPDNPSHPQQAYGAVPASGNRPPLEP